MLFFFLLLLPPATHAAETQAIAYLSREVPRWSKENHCFSCHNNGDGARALYVARRLSYRVPAEALANTTEWLLRPLAWDNNRGDPGVSDKKLARIQFAAATVLALHDRRNPKAELQVRQCLDLILRGQPSDGGWGPHIHSPSEPFDTAVVLLALVSLDGAPEIQRSLERGRARLLRTQLPSGGWPETTRPPGGQSYAQHISTSGWATLALLKTRGPRR